MQKIFTAAQSTFLVLVVINFEDGAKPAGFVAVNKTDDATPYGKRQFYKTQSYYVLPFRQAFLLIRQAFY